MAQRYTKQEQQTLLEVRLAIKGWAFAPKEWLGPTILRADGIANSLTGVAHAEANGYIQPLRNALKEL